MQTLIIYDNEGFILSQMSGSVREPVGVPFLWVEVSEGKYVDSIDTTGEIDVPVFDDLPKSETQLLQEQVNDLNLAMAALMGGAI